MNRRLILSLTALSAAVFVAGCAKKQVAPPPPPPPPPPVVDTVVPPPPPPPPPPVVVDTMALRRSRLQGLMNEVLKPIYFDLDQSSIKPEGKDMLARVGDLLKAYPELSVTIEGNADERGSTEYNQALGDRRAASAQSYLTSYGVSASQIKTVSYGEERPAATGEGEDVWSKNRRDEIPGEIR